MKHTLSLCDPATHIGLSADLSSPASAEEVKSAPHLEGVVGFEPRAYLSTEERMAVFSAPTSSDDESLIAPLSPPRHPPTSQPTGFKSIAEVRLNRALIIRGCDALKG